MLENQSLEWELDQESDDVRGWPVRDRMGNSLGKVRTLLVDTDTHYVIEVVLDDGTHIPARELVIGDHLLMHQLPAPSFAEIVDPPIADTLPPLDMAPMPEDSLRPIDVELPRAPQPTAAAPGSRRGPL